VDELKEHKKQLEEIVTPIMTKYMDKESWWFTTSTTTT
jgi:hypothetical protein